MIILYSKIFNQMTEKKSRNIFGDIVSPINAQGLALLSKLFSEVVIKHSSLSAYFEGMLEQMSSESKMFLIIKLSRWLKNQPNHFNAELEALLSSGKLPDVFEAALANWAQEMMLTIVARRSRIREVYATQLFPMLSTISIPIGVIHQESHHANHADMVYVCGMASAANAKRIFEFGTYRGQTTCGLATLCKDAQIYTLNLPPENDPRYATYIGMYIATSPDRDRITQIYHDSRTFDTTPYRESMDYIFIDGDHSYEGVKNDTEKALQLLKPGGVIVWHDYAAKSPGVLDYLAEFSQERPLFRLRKTCLAVYVDGVNPETAQLVPMDISLEAQEYE
jgi:predicted O-methyltransferase YrrM